MWPDATTPEEVDPLANYSPFGSADELLIQDEIAGCLQTLVQFLANPTPESRVGSLLGGTGIIGKVARHQQNNPVIRHEEQPALLHRAVLHTPAGPAIETLWELEGDRTVEAVFFKNDEDEWKI